MIEIIDIEKPEDSNIIIGQTHFIKSVEDIYEAIVETNPNIKFGIAFNEASGDRLIRKDGNDNKLIDIAVKNAKNIGAGHIFVIVMREGWPINILRALKQVSEVVNIYVATMNKCQVLIAKTDLGRGIVGVVDGEPPKDVENDNDVEKRKRFLRNIGYKR